VLRPIVARRIIYTAVCSILSFAFVEMALAREGAPDGARSKTFAQKVPAQKRKALHKRRNASDEEEPFCVRPFEYPRKSR
jgi:hypothetical protein